jgi:2-dehydro-3-deoxygalactonokinase
MVDAVVPEVAELPIWLSRGQEQQRYCRYRDCESRKSCGAGVEVSGCPETGGAGAGDFPSPARIPKFIITDGERRIAGCLTTLAGELLSVITNNTILASALNNSFVSRVDERMVLKGAECARQVGLSRACFTVRILDQFTDCIVEEKANFLLGAVLQTDLTALRFSRTFAVRPDMPVYIAGKRELREAFLACAPGRFSGDVATVRGGVLEEIAG